MDKNIIEKFLWSIALPGFGQFLNGKYFKGSILIILEFLINIKSSFNQIIILSFHFEIAHAIDIVNYQWLMFYPCIYFYAIWDAVKDAGGGKTPYSYFPYIFSAFFVTLGVIFSMDLSIYGVLLGPVWLPMLFVLPGVIIGGVIQRTLIKYFLKAPLV